MQMEEVMKDIFNLEQTTSIQRDDRFISSYPHILKHFSRLGKISKGDLVRGAHMIYGWMPTILHLHPDVTPLRRGAAILTKGRSRDLTSPEITALQGLVNNSIVGPSKLLHFIAPNRYAIWDSRVCRFVNRRHPGYRVDNAEHYLEYIALLQTLQRHRRFKSFHRSVNTKLGYRVSGLRALELVIFLNADK
jgi:hypothetical protein